MNYCEKRVPIANRLLIDRWILALFFDSNTAIVVSVIKGTNVLNPLDHSFSLLDHGKVKPLATHRPLTNQSGWYNSILQMKCLRKRRSQWHFVLCARRSEYIEKERLRNQSAFRGASVPDRRETHAFPLWEQTFYWHDPWSNYFQDNCKFRLQ